jgi:hypothetical protein
MEKSLTEAQLAKRAQKREKERAKRKEKLEREAEEKEREKERKIERTIERKKERLKHEAEREKERQEKEKELEKKRQEREAAQERRRQDREKERNAKLRFTKDLAPRKRFRLPNTSIRFELPKHALERVIRIKAGDDWATIALKAAHGGIQVVEFAPDVVVSE